MNFQNFPITVPNFWPCLQLFFHTFHLILFLIIPCENFVDSTLIHGISNAKNVHNNLTACKVGRISQILQKSRLAQLSQAKIAPDLKICRNDILSCCDVEIEHALFDHANLEFKKRLQDSVVNFWHMFDGMTSKIDSEYWFSGWIV